MNRTKLARLIWLFPIIFLIHDLEEILMIEDFLFSHSDMIPFKVTTWQFTMAFILLWILTFIGCIKALNNKNFLGMKPITFFSFLVPGIFLANGIGHCLQCIFFQGYVPGIITTIFLVLPYCFITLNFLVKEKLITVHKFLIFFVLGFVLQGPFALAAILIGKAIV